MKSVKEVTLKLHYTKSKVDKENGIYIGGVDEPKYQNELDISIGDDYDFDFDSDTFIKNGKYAVEISGSKRALKEFGKFLINFSMFETEDDNYHVHLDDISDENGEPVANITVRRRN